MKYVITCFLCCVLGFLTPAASTAEDYVIGKGDVLEVAVWGVEEMSRSVVVRPDGKITLPAIGDVVAENMAPAKLSKLLATEMKKYVKKPIVTVSVETIMNNRVYIIGGELSRVIDMANEMSLMKVMSSLGDLSQVDLRRAYLSRGGQKVSSDFYALFFEGDLSQDVELKAEDVIFMPSNLHNRVYVLGAVSAPQPVQYSEGMRVLDAILGAGGFTEFAKEESVIVVRKDQSKISVDLEKVRKKQTTDANILIMPGDYVLVEESLF